MSFFIFQETMVKNMEKDITFLLFVRNLGTKYGKK